MMPARLPTRIAAAIFALLVGSGAMAQKATDFLDTLDVRLVNIEVYVTDHRGRPVEGLSVEDFTLREDGRKVDLSHFSWVGAAAKPGETPEAPSQQPAPAHVLLLFDNFAIHPQTRKLILEDLKRYFEDELPAGFLYAVASYDGYLRIHQGFTRDRQRLLRAIADSGRLQPLGVLRQTERQALVNEGVETLRTVSRLALDEGRSDKAMRLLRTYSKQIDAMAERQRQQTRHGVFALSHLANALAALPGRKAVLYFSEGMPMHPGQELYAAMDSLFKRIQHRLVSNSSTGTAGQDAALDMRSTALGALEPGSVSSGKHRDDSAGFDALTALANASQVSFYTLKGSLGDGGTPAETTDDVRVLFTPGTVATRERNLAAPLRAMAVDTGGRFDLGTGAHDLLRDADSDLGNHYLLGYQPERQADGKYHRLEVSLRRKNLKVRHRRGYIDKTAESRLADRTSASLLLGHDDNPLGVELAFGPPAPGPEKDLHVVPVIVAIPLGFLDALPTSGKVPASLYIAARDPEGRTAPVQQLELELDPASEGGRQVTGFRMLVRRGPQRLAVGLVVPSAGASAFVSGELEVGPS